MFNQVYRHGDWVVYPRGSGRVLIGIVDSIDRERRDGSPILNTWMDQGDENLLAQWRALRWDDPNRTPLYQQWETTRIKHDDPWATVIISPRAYMPGSTQQGNRRTITSPQMVLKIDPPL